MTDPRREADRLLTTFGSLAEIYEICVSGDGPIAGMDLKVGSRLRNLAKLVDAALQSETAIGPVITDFSLLVTRLSLDMAGLPRETFRVLFLNAENRLLSDKVMWEGTVRTVQVHPREVVRSIIEIGATAVLFAHNHPSGDPTPSQGDIEITHKLVHACETVDVIVHDHIIVANRGNFSMRSAGMLHRPATSIRQIPPNRRAS